MSSFGVMDSDTAAYLFSNGGVQQSGEPPICFGQNSPQNQSVHRPPYYCNYDRDGNLVLLPEEAAQQRVEQEQQRTERLANRLRELGEGPEAL